MLLFFTLLGDTMIFLTAFLKVASCRARHGLVALLLLAALDGHVVYADGRTAPALQRGAKLLDAWQLEDAMGIAAHTLLHDPTSPHARAFAAEVMHQRGQHEEALALL